MIENPLKFKHPCFSNSGCDVSRMHVAVAPKCNIKCGFCKPTVSPCAHGCAPGLASKVLSPAEAVAWVREVREKKGVDIKIVGIAGPGEPLCNLETFQTLAMLREAFPEIHLCLSTNGLLLPQSVALIKSLGVETLTVTMNAFTVKTGAEIYEHVMGITGEEGVKILLECQKEGVIKAVEAGFVVKINSVYVPGINDDEIPLIAKWGDEHGANIHNILPLIPREKFANLKSPTREQVDTVRETSGAFMEQFLQCRHCRADAVIVADSNKLNRSR